MSKTKLQGCMQRIHYCKLRIENAYWGQFQCPTELGRKVMKDAYLRENERLAVLKEELKMLTPTT